MKKSLLALAVLGAFAGAASAQSSVTLYGLVDIGFQRIDPKADGVATTTGINSGIQSGSRFGFRGSEDLGGGLRAVFQLEAGVNPDDGTLGQPVSTTPIRQERIFGRWAWAGLAGGFGEVRLGRQWALGFEMFGNIDPFGTGFGDAGMQATFASANALRPDNMFMYRSPSLGGFRLNAGYSFNVAGGEAAGSSNNTRLTTVGAQYGAGPVLVVATYEIVKPPTATSTRDQTHLQLGATFDAKVVKVHAAYGQEEDQVAAGPRRFGTTGINNDAKSWLVGFTVPVGSLSLIASYQNRDADTNSCATTPTGTGVCDGRVIAGGFTYPLSRRTNFYGYYSDADADNVTNANDRKEMALGIRHTF